MPIYPVTRSDLALDHKTVPILSGMYQSHNPQQNGLYCIHVHQTEILESRETLIILHGYLRRIEDYNKLIQVFMSSYNIVSIDLRGHGDSEAPKQHSWSIEELSCDIYKVIGEIGADRTDIILLGHSLSSAIAIELTNSYPTLITKVVLISPTLRFHAPIFIKFLLKMSKFIPSSILQKYLKRGSSIAPKLVKNLDSEEYDRVRERFFLIDLEIHKKIFREAILTWEADITHISHPLLVLVSRDDNIISYQSSINLVNALKKSSEVTLSATTGVRHNLLDGATDFVINSMKRWLGIEHN